MARFDEDHPDNWYSPPQNGFHNDDVIRTENLPGNSFKNTGDTLVVGRQRHNTTDDALQGEVDELFLFRRAPTTEEQNWLYNDGNGRSYEELVIGMDDGGES